jgi:hypothetical protein
MEKRIKISFNNSTQLWTAETESGIFIGRAKNKESLYEQIFLYFRINIYF